MISTDLDTRAVSATNFTITDSLELVLAIAYHELPKVVMISLARLLLTRLVADLNMTSHKPHQIQEISLREAGTNK